MAPSVRVRRTDYSALRDPAIQRRSLFAIFQPPYAPQTTSTPATHDLPDHSSRERNLSLPTRRRSSHFGSLVHRHCRKSRSFAASALLLDRDDRASIVSSSHGSESRVASTQSSAPGSRYLPLVRQQRDSIARIDRGQGNVRSVLSSTGSTIPDGSILLDDEDGDHHHDDVVEHLDVIDPQVGAVSSLTNAANSIVFPPLSFYSRKPIVALPYDAQPPADRPASAHEDALDRHVEDVLNRPSRFRRTILGVWSFLKTPLGIITGIYGFLVVFWGAALVFFLGKIINLHNDDTQGFWVEVCSQIMNGLFTVTGIGLIPFRVLDTYRIVKIWWYKQVTKRRRAKAGLPQLFDRDDLPDPEFDPNYVHVLTDEEQHDLHRQQRKFHYSQTWYRAHGTETHRAFPINVALTICFLNDGNSIFQILLCATMWGLNRFERPAWSTGILIPASFLCGIFSGIFIWYGGHKTKRTEKVEELLRAALEQVRNHEGTEPQHPQGQQATYGHEYPMQVPGLHTDAEKAETPSAIETAIPPGHANIEQV